MKSAVRIADGPSVSPSDIARWAPVFKALGHPARLQILHYLRCIDECFCGDIVDRLPLAQSTVSQHLKVLKEAGLIEGRISGPATCYCLDRRLWQRFKAVVGRL